MIEANGCEKLGFAKAPDIFRYVLLTKLFVFFSEFSLLTLSSRAKNCRIFPATAKSGSDFRTAFRKRGSIRFNQGQNERSPGQVKGSAEIQRQRLIFFPLID